MKESRSIGVVIGRFQVPSLHKGHIHLLQLASERHTHLMVVLGSSAFPTPRNPLSFEMRKAMILKLFPRACVTEAKDHRSDVEWAEHVDRLIAERFPMHEVVLYGSRDSFAPRYRGRFRTELVPDIKGHSGTAARAKAALHEGSSAAFRRGVIHGWTARLPVTRPMVDIAIIRGGLDVLLGGKEEDPSEKWRFPGGLVDPHDKSLEDAVMREACEEVSHIEVSKPRYVGSSQANDWRYLGSGESGMTALFASEYVFGAPKAGDDLARVAWVPISKLQKMLVKEHKHLGRMLTDYLAASAGKKRAA